MQDLLLHIQIMGPEVLLWPMTRGLVTLVVHHQVVVHRQVMHSQQSIVHHQATMLHCHHRAVVVHHQVIRSKQPVIVHHQATMLHCQAAVVLHHRIIVRLLPKQHQAIMRPIICQQSVDGLDMDKGLLVLWRRGLHHTLARKLVKKSLKSKAS